MAASVALTQIKTFSVTTTPRYFDGQQGRFGDTLTYNVSCYKIDLQNVDSPKVSEEVVEGLEALRSTRDFLDLEIKGQTIKYVKLLDFSFEEGDFSKYGLVNLVFERYGQAETNQIVGDLYECFNQLIADDPLKRTQTYFEAFSEDFNFNEGKNSTSYSYTLNITLRDQAGDGDMLATTLSDSQQRRMGGVAISYAREFAKNIFECESRPAIDTFSSVVAGLYQKNYKKSYSEDYDLISNTCAFSENFTTTNIEQAGGDDPYSLVVTQRSFRDEVGTITISEDGEIGGLGSAGKHDKYPDALVGLGAELNNATGRLQAFYERISGKGDAPLARDCEGDLRILSTETSKNPFDGTITYSVETNNEKAEKCTCSGTLLVEDTVGENAGYSELQRTISIEGWGVKVTGDGDPAADPPEEVTTIRFPRFENARDLLLKAGTASPACIDPEHSVYATFTNTWTPLCGPVQDEKGKSYSPAPINESWSYAKNEGEIAVDLTWSTNPVYASNARGTNALGGVTGNWIKRFELNRDLDASVPRYNTFQGLNLGVYAEHANLADEGGGVAKVDQIMQSYPGNTSPQGLSQNLSIVSVRAGDLSVFGLDPESNDPPPRLKQLLQVAEEAICKKNNYLIQGANYSYAPLNDCTFQYSINYIDSDKPEISFTD